MRRPIAAAVVVAAVVGWAAPVSAKTASNSFLTNEGVGTSVNSSPEGAASRSRGKASPEECETKPINPRVEGLFIVDDKGNLRRLYDEEHQEDKGAWYRRVCYLGTTQTAYSVSWVPNADPAALARQALDHAPLPTPKIAISAEIPAVTLTGFPQWLWIDPSAWNTVTASASLDGLTATVTAQPTGVVWDSGDDRASASERRVNCTGPGKPLPANADYDQQMSGSNCIYRYLHTSGHESDLAFDLSATIYWNVTWTATDGSSGSLGPVSRNAAIPIKVGEDQVINVSPRS